MPEMRCDSIFQRYYFSGRSFHASVVSVMLFPMRTLGCYGQSLFFILSGAKYRNTIIF